MPRFHFHILDGVNLFDSAGLELADEKAALKHAEQIASDLSKSKTMDRDQKVIRITNEDGREISRLPVLRQAKRG